MSSLGRIRHPLALFLLTIGLAACESAVVDRFGDGDGKDDKDDDGAKTDEKNNTSTKSGSGTDRTGDANKPSTAPAPTTTPPNSGGPFRTPKETRNISNASQVWNGGSFDGSVPTIRANDKHGGQSVAGKDCLSCHNGSQQAAPRFAFAGTVAEGKKWEWGGSSWFPPGPPFLGWGGYGESKPSGVWGSYGWQQEGKAGWPKDRSKPASGCDVRIIGADGLVFDTVTDQDGNFWYKTQTELKQPGYTGVRDGSFQRALKSNGTSCASCHENGKSEPGRIWVWDGKEPEPSSSSSSSSSGFPFPPFPF